MNKILTDDERDYIVEFYYPRPVLDGKLSLKQVKHMTDGEIYMLCYWVEREPFARHKQSECTIEREFDTIVFKAGIHAYHIDINTCNVSVYLDGRKSTEGNNGNAFQYYRKYKYAFPLMLEKGHWANRKTQLQLGLAIPDLQPINDALNQLYDNDKNLIEQWFSDKKYWDIDLENIDVFETQLAEIKQQLLVKS